MNTFILVLTLCGTLSDSSKSTCEKYVIDHDLSRIDCLESIATVYNNEKTDLYNVMGDMGEPWDMIQSSQLHCVVEDRD